MNNAFHQESIVQGYLDEFEYYYLPDEEIIINLSPEPKKEIKPKVEKKVYKDFLSLLEDKEKLFSNPS
jgi:hypothetical protein